MSVTGIIAEYNPFHNGHLYQINEVKKLGAEYIIVVMSGDFVQRGSPSIADKYIRTKMALQNGADLVLELPVLYATGSAQYFARGAISILDKLNVVNNLCFGCEASNTNLLLDAAKFLSKESPQYKKELQDNLKLGYSFPKSRELVITNLLGNEISSVLSSPNNILALEYCLAIIERNSNMIPLPLKRKGNQYHESNLTASSFPSATAIRNKLENASFPEEIKDYVPENVYDILQTLYKKNFPIIQNDFSSILKYKLLLEEANGFQTFVDITSSLSDKIRKNINQFRYFDQFCECLKSKDITYTRINRCLTHILLHITEETLNFYKGKDYTDYARILGFRQSALPLLSMIKENSNFLLLSKLADGKKNISDEFYSLLDYDILSSHIYESVVSEKYKVPFQNEFTRQIVII